MAQTVPSFSDQPGEWIRHHQRRITFIAGPIVVLGLGFWFVRSWQARKEAAAAAAFDVARSVAEASNFAAASAQLQQIIERYSGTDAANQAVIALNQVRMINGQYALAAVNLQQYLSGHPAPAYAVPAYGLLAAALENTGRPADAADAYLKASQAADLDYLKADYLLKAGRAYAVAGKTDQAIAALDTVATKYQKTPVYTEAAVRLAELSKGALPKRDDAISKVPTEQY